MPGEVDDIRALQLIEEGASGCLSPDQEPPSRVPLRHFTGFTFCTRQQRQRAGCPIERGIPDRQHRWTRGAT